MIKFSEYKKILDSTPESEGLEFKSRYFWHNMWRYPRILVSLGDNKDPVIRVPAEVETQYNCKPPVTAVSGSAFRGNETVTDIILPPSVSSIGTGAFANCTHLKRITIPKKVTCIPEAAFGNCRELEDIYYEGSREEWSRVRIVHEKHEVGLTGELIPGTPVEVVRDERLEHIPGNEALYCCNIHLNCDLGESGADPQLHLYVGGKEITEAFTVKG
ncbi:MAG: leucine-rich repeat domain-containing protein [Lachnospiraceae bacterium]|nr:leucine-rich repeat domain-containing protein [Lachnospiraceae bacterium]